MSEKSHFLIFGSLSPITGPVSNLTTQLAIWLTKKAKVTVVISDQTPSTLDKDAAGFSIMRERDIAPILQTDHKRLFVLGDNYQSLWALKLYREFGGAVLPAAKTLSNLHRLHYQRLKSWPDAYCDWLENNLGNAGQQLAHALLHHRRESISILREVPLGTANAALVDDTFINPDDILLGSFFFAGDQVAHKTKAAEKPKVAVLHDSSWSIGLDELLELDKETLPPFDLVSLSGNEIELAEQVCGADILLVLETEQLPPIGLQWALSSGTAVITCSQAWLADMPFKAGLNVCHAKAQHELKAALGALLSSAKLLEWAGIQGKALYNSMQVEETQQAFLAALQQFKHAPVKTETIRKPTSQISHKQSPAVFQVPEGKQAFALIGAVPPPGLAEKLLPFVDSSKSPRFATPEVAEQLCDGQDVYQANKLALLGYEAPVIGDGHHSWAEIQPELKQIENAICFGPPAEGTVDAASFICRADLTNIKITIDFEAIDAPSTLAYQNKKNGLYWRRDPIQQTIEAILVAGLSGSYKCSMQAKGLALSLNQQFSTHLLTASSPIELSVDQYGILKFNISVFDSSNMNQLTDTLLINSLATLTLDLEWLGYGK